MKRFGILLSIAAIAFSMSACSVATVQPGNVGIKVNLSGSAKGVDQEVLPVGWYVIGPTEQLYTFPTFEKNFPWTKELHEGHAVDESISFQTREGLNVNVDMGITFHIPPEKVATVFQKYRLGIDEITDTFLRNNVRDAMNEVSSTMPVESIYGDGKTQLLAEVTKKVRAQVEPLGISVTNIYFIGQMRLPPQVVDAINAKITATQQAMQAQNELARTQAEAQKQIAAAQGEAQSHIAQANGEAAAILSKAKAQAEANLTLSRSLTPELVEYIKANRWNGELPQYMFGSGVTPLLNLSK